jgi:hypothetical protein
MNRAAAQGRGLFGLDAFRAEPMLLYAVALIAGRGETNPLQRVLDADGTLSTRESRRADLGLRAAAASRGMSDV